MTDGFHCDRDMRLADLHVRLSGDEFAGAFNMDSEPTAEQLAAECRDEFRLYAYSARVDHDPARDFDGFLEGLWALVTSRFRLLPEDSSDAWARVSRPWWDHPDDPRS